MKPGSLVSVVVPTYNRASTLRRAVESVLGQSYANLELIVVDDASTDDTKAVLSSIDDPRMRVITHEFNKGCAAARNTGAMDSRGLYLAFQDRDDEWLADKLSKQVAAFVRADDKCVATYCIKVVYGRDQSRKYGIRRVVCVPGPDEIELSGRDLKRRLQETNLVSTQTILCSKRAFDLVGGFDEKLKNSVDYDFVYRLSGIGDFAFVDEPLVMTYIQGDSISRCSKAALYSQLIITNKKKRRGVSRRSLAGEWAHLGYRIGKNGFPRRGQILLRAALAEKPLTHYIWLRYLVNTLRMLRRLRAQ
jgi:glycosyltransferase involved in cell wall biosynthesis